MSLYCQEGIVDPVETWVNARHKFMVEKAGKEKCKLEAKVSVNVEGLSVVVLVARATSRK